MSTRLQVDHGNLLGQPRANADAPSGRAAFCKSTCNAGKFTMNRDLGVKSGFLKSHDLPAFLRLYLFF